MLIWSLFTPFIFGIAKVFKRLYPPNPTLIILRSGNHDLSGNFEQPQAVNR